MMNTMKKLSLAVLASAVLLFGSLLIATPQTFAADPFPQWEEQSGYASFPDHFLCQTVRQQIWNNVSFRCNTQAPRPGFPRVLNEYVVYARQVGPRLFECRYHMTYECVVPPGFQSGENVLETIIPDVAE